MLIPARSERSFRQFCVTSTSTKSLSVGVPVMVASTVATPAVTSTTAKLTVVPSKGLLLRHEKNGDRR